MATPTTNDTMAQNVQDFNKAGTGLQPPPYEAGPSLANEPRRESSSTLEQKVPESDGEDDSGDQSAAPRPPLDYSSWVAFFASVWRRFESIWTKRFVWSLLAGQVVSLCITCTNVTTTELVSRNWALPTTQTFFL